MHVNASNYSSTDGDNTETLKVPKHRRTSSAKQLQIFKSPSTQYERKSTSFSGEKLREKWDAFRDVRENDPLQIVTVRSSTTCEKFCKILTYFFTCVALLFCSVFSKLTLFLTTSQITELLPKRNISTVVKLTVDDVGSVDDVVIGWFIAVWIIVSFPHVLSLYRCSKVLLFRTTKWPSIGLFTVWFCVETTHTVGICILAFRILPIIDAIPGAALLTAVCIVPGVLRALYRSSSQRYVRICLFCDTCAILMQCSVFAWICLTMDFETATYCCFSMVCISLSYWESLVSRDSWFKGLSGIALVKKQFRRRRHKAYLIINVWKVGFSFGLMVMFLWLIFGKRFKFEMSSVAVIVAFLQCIVSTCGYIVAKFACKILIQEFSFGLPLIISTPTALVFLFTRCSVSNHVNALVRIPDVIAWNCQSQFTWAGFVNYVGTFYLWMWIFWFISFVWITSHMWTPCIERLAKSSKIFVRPFFCGVLFDVGLVLNRNRDDKLANLDLDKSGLGRLNATLREALNESIDPNADLVNHFSKNGKPAPAVEEITTRIYFVATMWHETAQEMRELMKSIFRTDQDQCARRLARDYFNQTDNDFYIFECHIFMDNAFDYRNGDPSAPVVNGFVKQFIRVLTDAARAITGAAIDALDFKKIPTPYGGRLEWTLPGGNLVYFHMKDVKKIRQKKRWSQVMYLYYLLGWNLLDKEQGDARTKQAIADNSYLLMLDGDVNFSPAAVLLLVDLLKKNVNVAAACGRIHPVGTGPMVWYQKFEYAIGHWLQKATEHMIGCVLCSPGCFSLCRASALMAPNIISKYRSTAESAVDYLQFNQGEDRWLCTLLLQQGFRIEYCAAADAYTYCPEALDEFFNQRRRWMPSTIANIIDLLITAKQTIKKNQTISWLYIAYQSFLLGTSILGPGVTFLMVVGALSAAFPTKPGEESLRRTWISLIINAIPVVIFCLSCFYGTTKTQLKLAAFLTGLYGVEMTIVIVGTLVQIVSTSILGPTAFFFWIILGSFVFAAVLHPQEFTCIFHLLIYFLAIPSTFILLMIYSICNLNQVSWGTRETTQSAAEPQADDGGSNLSKMIKKLGLSNGSFRKKVDAVLSFKFHSLFQVACCLKEDKQADFQHMVIVDQMKQMEEKLDSILVSIEEGKGDHGSGRKQILTLNSNMFAAATDDDDDDDDVEEVTVVASTPVTKSNEFKRDVVLWTEESEMDDGQFVVLDRREKAFWDDVLKQYLAPLPPDKQREQNLTEGLNKLKNTGALVVFILNSLFVTIVFFLEINPIVHVPWVLVGSEKLTPIAMTFMTAYVLVLFLQGICMLSHRLGTFMHIMAATKLEFRQNKEVTPSGEEDLLENGVNYAIQMLDLKPQHEDDTLSVDSFASGCSLDESGNMPVREGVRKNFRTLVRTPRSSRQRQGSLNYENAFKRRLEKLPNPEAAMNPEEMQADVSIYNKFKVRRETLVAMSQKRKKNNRSN